MSNATPISELINVDDLPDIFSFLETPASSLLSNILFDYHEIGYSADNTTVSHTLHLISNQEYGITVPGIGLRLILNPTGSGTSGFWCNVNFYKGILAYVSSFRIDGFSETLTSIHDLATKLFPGNDVAIYFRAVNAFETGSNNIHDGYNRINNYCSLNNVYDPNKTEHENFQILAGDIFQNCSSSAWEIVIALYITGVSGLTSEQKKNRTVKLFLNPSDTLEPINYSDFVSFIKNKLIPQIRASFNLVLGLEIPRRYLIPVKTDGTIETNPAISLILTLAESIVTFDSKQGLKIENDVAVSFPPQHPMAQIGNTSLKIGFVDARIVNNVDVNNKSGLYIQEATINFPLFWNPDSDTSTGIIRGKRLLIGSGGITGVIQLEALSQPGGGSYPNPKTLFRLGNHTDPGKHFELGLSQFLIEFSQGAIVKSKIRGYMKIPGFKDTNNNDAKIDVLVHIGNNGDFRITASEADGIQVIRIPNILDLSLRSVSIGREDDKWYLEASGSLKITATIPHVTTDFLQQPIDIKKIRIYQDGSIEFENGGIALPTHISINIGPVALSMDNIGYGSHEAIYAGNRRQYSYLIFNGNVKTDNGSLNVRGKGVEFHFTRDGGPLHTYLRISEIGVDIKIPGDASKEDADVYISGYLAMRHGRDANNQPIDAGPEYQGAVTVVIKKFKGKAAMIMRPKVPAWIVDIELELPTPLALGATGLGIYGFRGLVGSHYVASKQKAFLNDDDSWYEYLKKKGIQPQPNRQGIHIGKFDDAKKGFSVGIGASIATMGDEGWTFSSKVFIMLSMPEMLLIEGQANVLHKRLGIESENDPPFYAFLVLDNNSIQAGIGVNYNVPDSGNQIGQGTAQSQKGHIVSLRGEMQLAFFFANSSAWYINIGKDLPEEKRVQARLFKLFDAYAYLMLSSKGIKAGAGAKLNLQERFGPVSVGLYAFIDTKGFISFRPIQIGGSIQLGGGLYIKVGRFGIEIHVMAGLSAEAPSPFVISGFIEIKLKIFIIKVKIRLEFTWIFSKKINTAQIPLLDPVDFQNLPAHEASNYPFKAINMLSEEAFVLKYLGNNLSAANPSDVSWNAHIIPIDSYIDIEFKRPVKPYTTRYGGGIAPLPQYIENVAPQRSRMPQAKHSFSVENVEIKIFNPQTGQWDEYNPWDALTRAFQNAGLSVNTTSYPFGFWQYNNSPGKYTSLRFLAQSPFAVLNGTPPEHFGLLSEHLFCAGPPKNFTCQYWNEMPEDKVYLAPDTIKDRKLLLRFNAADGTIGSVPNVFGVSPSLKVAADNKLEIYFPEPMGALRLRLTTFNPAMVRYYRKVFLEYGINGLPNYEYQLISETGLQWSDCFEDINYNNGNDPVSKVEIKTESCNENLVKEVFFQYWNELVNRWQNGIPGLSGWQEDQRNLWLEMYANGDITVAAIAIRNLCTEWQYLHENVELNGAEQERINEWINNYCNNTDFENVLNHICEQFVSVLQNLEDYPVLYSYVFTWQEKYCNNANIGYNSFDLCSLYLHEACWLTEEQWQYNLLLQQNNQAVITTGANSLTQAINQALPPVWRPNSAYAIMVKTKQDVEDGGAIEVTQSGYPYTQEFFFGFKTSGTLGFYHRSQQAYLVLEQNNKADQYKLSGLRHYIDYQRSYPNADGQLLNAKPLYYKNPKLALYFSKPYVYEFFTKWDFYKGNAAKEYQLVSIIRDPLDALTPVTPPEIMGWQIKKDQQSIPVDALDIETISNVLVLGERTCTNVVRTVLKPPTANAVAVRNYEIKPQKLYTALFKAVEVDGTSTPPEAIVHSYTFQTSRYGDFTEHIESYKRKITDPDTGQQHMIHAIFNLDIGLPSAEVQQKRDILMQIFAGSLPQNEPLIAKYASVYDRIVNGVLQLPEKEAVTGVELTVIKGMFPGIGGMDDTEGILGILVKSPEPFYDPKIPKVELAKSIKFRTQGEPIDTPGSGCLFVYSKDNSCIFISNAFIALPQEQANLFFFPIEFNGVEYEQGGGATIPVALGEGLIPIP